MFPTPTVSDATRGGFQSSAKRVKNGRGRQLVDVAKMWPTPVKAAYKGASLKAMRRKDGRSRADRIDYAVAQEEGTIANGQLNPNWVEWLMGYPVGWTELNPSETPSSRKSQRKS